MQEEQELIQNLNTDFPINLPAQASLEDLHAALSQYINHLILHGFNQLINLLYRLDVSETKLQQWLLENTTEDAGKIIATLIIERQVQKIKSRSQFRREDTGSSDDERW